MSESTSSEVNTSKSARVPITSVLVANRGEIARRVFRTCRDLGISTVAVYSDADAESPHVAEADVAVHLPGNAPADTYLRGDLIIAAARRAGADAIHPGYGFLSENAAFAAAVEAAGLIWIGPPVAAIESMGSKIESKQMMAAVGVPVLDDLDPAAVTQADLPVLIKASAGGGGRGMRVVRNLADLAREVSSAAAEAQSAFGDATVFCEPYLATGRHIEVQVMADRHGTVWAVGERECSIQRRHQKIVEEAPSPLVERVGGMRERLFSAAVAAAEAVDYVGAGTVEFLADDDGRFFFLEMNTRLQVEHPVTECTTGLDLVALQVRVAAGEELPTGGPPPSAGHSIEVRLYAEDPVAGWQPQSGRLHRFEVPGTTHEFIAPAAGGGDGLVGLRVDSGVADGFDVGIHYDPMLAKVIAVAPDRQAAARRLATALERTRIHGLITNRDLLVRVLRHPAFLAGETDTAFLDRHWQGRYPGIGPGSVSGEGPDGVPTDASDVSSGGRSGAVGAAGASPLDGRLPVGLVEPLNTADEREVMALAAALADAAANRVAARVLGGVPSGWRNVWSQHQRKTYRVVGAHEEPAPGSGEAEPGTVGERGGEITVEYTIGRDGLRLPERPRDGGPSAYPGPRSAGGRDGDEGPEPAPGPGGRLVELVRSSPEQVVLLVSGVRRNFDVARYPSPTAPGGPPALVVVDTPRGSVTLEPVDRFPDPDSQAAPGSLLAPMPGSVIRVAVSQGDVVEQGQVLLWLEAMKMQHEVRAPAPGVVTELPATEGRQVEVGEVLAVVQASTDSDER